MTDAMTTTDTLGLARPGGWTSAHDWPGACRIEIERERPGAAPVRETREASIGEASAVLDAWRAQADEETLFVAGEVRSDRAYVLLLVAPSARGELHRSITVTPNVREAHADEPPFALEPGTERAAHG